MINDGSNTLVLNGRKLDDWAHLETHGDTILIRFKKGSDTRYLMELFRDCRCHGFMTILPLGNIIELSLIEWSSRAMWDYADCRFAIVTTY